MPHRLTAVLLAVLIANTAAAEDDPPKPRRYEDGPLTKKDFAAKAPSPLPVKGGVQMKAVVRTEFHYNYRFSYVNRDDGVELKITKVEVLALMLPGKSWNASADDAKLMDHEQGHFDITAAYVAMARKELASAMKRGEFQSTGKDVETAKKAAVKKIDAIVKDAMDAGQREDRRYDDETRHGVDPIAQAKHRRHHRRLLEQLGVIKDKAE